MTLWQTFQQASKTLLKNPLRSVLTLVGITIGVGAVITMVAVGSGARATIEEHVAAAGMNVITVVAGNYRMKGEDGGGGVEDHNARLGGDGVSLVAHPEDDPMEKHDHPTARQRLGDSAAGIDPSGRRGHSPGNSRRAVRLRGCARVRARCRRRSEVVHATAWRRTRSATDPTQLDLAVRPLLLGSRIRER